MSTSTTEYADDKLKRRAVVALERIAAALEQLVADAEDDDDDDEN